MLFHTLYIFYPHQEFLYKLPAKNNFGGKKCFDKLTDFKTEKLTLLHKVECSATAAICWGGETKISLQCGEFDDLCWWGASALKIYFFGRILEIFTGQYICKWDEGVLFPVIASCACDWRPPINISHRPRCVWSLCFSHTSVCPTIRPHTHDQHKF